MRYGMNMVAPAVLALFLALPSSGQDVRTQVSGVAEVEQMAALSGALYAEDMGEEEIERLVNLQNRPLKLNLASRSRLTESGLFSQYQVAALMDYRERNGDILSVSELAAVDGFGRIEILYLVGYRPVHNYRKISKNTHETDFQPAPVKYGVWFNKVSETAFRKVVI